MKYWDVNFDKTYLERPGVKPLQNIVPLTDNEYSHKIVKDFFNRYWSNCKREPTENMKFPYLVPGATYNDLWDWDSFIMSCAVSDENLEYSKGSVQNLIAGMDEKTGKPTKKYTVEGLVNNLLHPYPIQAQFAYIIAKRMNDFSWVGQYWEKFKRMILWYENNCKNEGLFVWQTLQGNGIDNNPAVYGRDNMSSAGIDLAAFHYREYKAMAKLAKMFEPVLEKYYLQKANELKEVIQSKYFDWGDKFFYNIDCHTLAPQELIKDYPPLQRVDWVTYLKFKNCASLFSLWGGVATPEQAKYIRDKIMDEDEFLSCCGVRTHSKSDMCYNNEPMGNPSNWQGPVWGLSTFFTAYGLARYGYKEEALEVAFRLIRTFAADIGTNGCVHEYYHGDTGQPLMKPGFVSWNILAINVIDDILNVRDCTTLDLLD